MQASEAGSFVQAFGDLVDTLFKIANTPGGLLVLLLLGIIVMGVMLWRIRGRLEQAVDSKFADLNGRLTACESRHAESVAREHECKERERKNLLAIATLHGVIHSIEATIPGSVHIPSLDELFSGQWSTAQSYNPEVAVMAGDGDMTRKKG